VKEITQKMSVEPGPFWAGGRVEGLKAVPAVHSDVGSSVSHLVVRQIDWSPVMALLERKLSQNRSKRDVVPQILQ
jgi:hypothetical protein